MNTLDSVCHLIKTIEDLTASNILSITFKCKIQIFRCHPSAPNNFDSSGLGWVGECVFATCSLNYSSVHPGLRSTDQVLLAEHSFLLLSHWLLIHLITVPSTTTWEMKTKCARCAYSPKKATGEEPNGCRVHLTTR